MIEVVKLCKHWGDVRAVDDLSFDVQEGETFAIIGPNGAGKTTALKCVLGLVRPDSGRIAIGPDRLPPDDPRARTALGWVPQRCEFAPGRTVVEVLSFFAALRGLGQDAVRASIDRVGLGEYAGRRANTLSGGYAQRLSLAQALLGDPALLVLDEPTASLDPQATWEFRSLVLELKAQGRTILLCSHLLDEVERVADRVLILVGGRAAALESMSDLRARQVEATRLVADLGEAPTRALEALAQRGLVASASGEAAITVEARDGRFLEALDVLRTCGIAVRSVEMQRPSLEEVFLATVRGETGAKP